MSMTFIAAHQGLIIFYLLPVLITFIAGAIIARINPPVSDDEKADWMGKYLFFSLFPIANLVCSIFAIIAGALTIVAGIYGLASGVWKWNQDEISK